MMNIVLDIGIAHDLGRITKAMKIERELEITLEREMLGNKLGQDNTLMNHPFATDHLLKHDSLKPLNMCPINKPLTRCFRGKIPYSSGLTATNLRL